MRVNRNIDIVANQTGTGAEMFSFDGYFDLRDLGCVLNSFLLLLNCTEFSLKIWTIHYYYFRVQYEEYRMTGYTVHTGSSKAYSDGWDEIFGGGKQKKPTQAEKKPVKAAKKKSKKKK